ncbi:hypothetical protein [Microbacterium rhizophilus]|uniref:hypothetical protein n=1 Tax=Microbacterium rhizophilus TaxID=3138934 RepID=UPI0031E80EDE
MPASAAEPDTRTPAPPARRTARATALVAAAGAALGVLAFLADGFQGPVGAVAMGVVSSASSWLLGTSVVGFLASTRRSAPLRAALFMAAATTAYYALRWGALEPWRMGSPDPASEPWNSPAGLRFLLVAIVWLVGTAAGGAVVGALAHAIPRPRGRANAVAIGLWLGVCAAPALAYLPDLVSNAVAAGTAPGWIGTADTSAPFVLVSALSALILVVLAIPAVARRCRALHPSATLVLTALTSNVLLAVVFRLGTDVVRAILDAL